MRPRGVFPICVGAVLVCGNATAQAENAAPAKAIEVTVRAVPRPKRDPGQATIPADEATKIAGAQGDALKVVENLPGVARPSLASGQIVLWGAAPKDTRVYVDGVEIPRLYHTSGIRSVINADLVSSVDLVPGAFGPEYGRGMGGLVRVETRAIPSDGVHGYLGADEIDASAMASAPIGARIRAAVAGRYGYLDRVMSAVSAPDVGDYFPIPRYGDMQVKVSADMRENESVDAVWLGSEDRLTRTVASPDPARTKSDTTRADFQRLYLRYRSITAEGDGTTVTPFVGRDLHHDRTAFGATPTALDVGSYVYGLRASYRTRLHPNVSATLGFDAQGTSSALARSGSLTLPPREGDVFVFGQAPGSETNADDWSAHILDMAPNASADLRLGNLTVTGGARLETFLIEGSRGTPRVGQTPSVGYSRLEGSLDPRLSARYQLTPDVAFMAGGGTYHQAPAPEDLSAVFGTPDLAASKATHVSFGDSIRLSETTAVDTTGFFKSMDDLVVRSRLLAPKLARTLVQNGEGKSFGIQFLIRQRLSKGFFGWIAYTVSRSERRYVGDGRYRLSDYDQPHVLTAVASKEIGRWTFGARFRYATGYPRTPVVGSFFESSSDEYQPIFGVQNGIRIPGFYQLDLRAEHLFALGRGVSVVVFADVQNVTFRKNPEEIVYSSDFRRRGYITGLPTLAVVGGRVEF
jgi:hypothetical protein